MPVFHVNLLLKLIILFTGWGTLADSVWGQTKSPFRVDTDVYADESKPPIHRTLTLFSDGIYYDFEESPNGLITVIDPQRSRIVLLNRDRQVKAVVDTKQLQLMVSSARVQADAKIASISKRAVENAGSTREEAIVLNDFIEYRASLQKPIEPDMAQQYADFADWSARLNAVYPPSLPPYLRMELNQLIAEHHALPEAIKKTTRQRGRQVTMTCRLMPVWRLSEDDLMKMARCGAMLAEFKEIPVSEYWSSPAPVTKASATLPTKR